MSIPSQESEVESLAIFLPNWVGDVVMATPAIRALRNTYRASRLIGVLRPYVADVLGGLNWFDEIVPTERGLSRIFTTARRLRQFRPDTALLFPNSFRSALIAWLAGCRRRIGYRRYGRGPLLTTPLSPIRDESGRVAPSPVIDAYNALAVTAGCDDPGYAMVLALTDDDMRGCDEVWQRLGLVRYRRVVAFNPGGAFGSAKHWPTPYFAELARSVVDRLDCAVLVLCGPKERDTAREIVGLADTPRVTSLADERLSIGLTKACIARSDLLVTTDSGPRHFGIAFGKPVVSLFGPTHIEWTRTYHPLEVCLQKVVPCGPCQRRVCPFDHRCMNELRPSEVLTAILELWNRANSLRHAELGKVS